MSEKKRDVTTLLIFGLAVLGGLIVAMRLFIFDFYHLPAESMSPTLNRGDFVVTLRHAYARSGPEPGDVVVFRNDTGTVFLKRVIGLPGQTVGYNDKRLWIDGVPVLYTSPHHNNSDERTYRVTETVGRYRYDVMLHLDRSAKEGQYQVPQGHYLLLGDNRDNSHDSRYPGVGMIPRDRILGRIVYALGSGLSGIRPQDNAVRRTALPD